MPSAHPHPPRFRISKLLTDNKPLNLKEEIVKGLQQDQPCLPQLLLWNDRGLKLFDELSQNPAYYLNEKEVGILQSYADEIAACIPSNSLLVELGSGSLRKTGIILSALERRRRSVSYYALDVSLAELNGSLDALATQFAESKYIKFHGLWGTYEDGLEWLSSNSGSGSDFPQNATFLWMGNSAANMGRLEAKSLLSRFSEVCAKSNIGCQFIVGIDACENEQDIDAAYSSNEVRTFIMNGLISANDAVGRVLFTPEEWAFAAEFDTISKDLHVSYVLRRDFELQIGGHCLNLREGQKVRVITSGKWPERTVRALVKDVPLNVVDVWRAQDRGYCFYRLQPSPSPNCEAKTPLASSERMASNAAVSKEPETLCAPSHPCSYLMINTVL